jgi:hypothetical protein
MGDFDKFSVWSQKSCGNLKLRLLIRPRLADLKISRVLNLFDVWMLRKRTDLNSRGVPIKPVQWLEPKQVAAQISTPAYLKIAS